METVKEIQEAKIRDALTWVAQEARALVLQGVALPPGSKLREALVTLSQTYSERHAHHER